MLTCGPHCPSQIIDPKAFTRPRPMNGDGEVRLRWSTQSVYLMGKLDLRSVVPLVFLSQALNAFGPRGNVRTCFPSLRRWFLTVTMQESGNFSLGRFYSKFQQFPMNSGRTPEPIGIGYLEHRSLYLGIYRRPSTFTSSGLAPAIKLESPLVPAHNGFRMNDHNCASPP